MAYDKDTLKGNVNLNDGFNLFHHNSGSILKGGRIDEYDILLESIENPFHIMAFSETWLKSDNADRISFSDSHHVHIIRPLNGDVDDREIGGGHSFVIKHGNNYNV